MSGFQFPVIWHVFQVFYLAYIFFCVEYLCSISTKCLIGDIGMETFLFLILGLLDFIYCLFIRLE